MAKFYWIVAGSLSEMAAFVNDASHRFAALPLTKPAISDFGWSGNPIRRHVPASPYAAARAWWGVR